ncbi:unnamed protein product, partial [Amoebophrya sp. A25]|eukprot:GSA25T00015767001.1
MFSFYYNFTSSTNSMILMICGARSCCSAVCIVAVSVVKQLGPCEKSVHQRQCLIIENDRSKMHIQPTNRPCISLAAAYAHFFLVQRYAATAFAHTNSSAYFCSSICKLQSEIKVCISR